MKIFTFSLKKNFFNILFISFTILLVLFSRDNFGAAKNGLVLWTNNIIPALFPFFVATELLGHTNIIAYLGRFFNKIMRPFFNVPGEGSYPLIMGFISGYPMGAKIVTDLRIKNILTKVEAERLLAFTNNSGPLFILGTIGISLFKDSTIGIILLLTHFLSSITIGFLFRFWKYNNCNISSSGEKFSPERSIINFRNFGDILSSSIKNSILTILNIGGFIVLFSVIISIFNKTHFLDLTYAILSPIFNFFGIDYNFSRSIINGIFEITTGVEQVSSIPIKNLSFSISICAFIIGFGGISVLMQVYSFTSKSDISILPYILGKFLQGIIASLYTFLIFHYFTFISLDLSYITNFFEYLLVGV